MQMTIELTRTKIAAQISAFITIRTVINTMIRMVYPFLAIISRGLGVDLAAMSYALSIRSLTGLVGPLIASVADSRGRKTGMLLGVFLFTLGVGIFAIWPIYPVFVATLVLTILGNFVFIPSMQAYLGDRVSYQRRGMALALSEIGWSLSFIVGVPAAGYLIAQFGWRSPFPIMTGLGILALLILTWMLPKDEVIPAGTRPNMWSNFRIVLTHKPALAGIVFAVLISLGNEVINLVFGVWLEDSFGLKITALGLVAAIIGFAELGGEALVSGLVDRLGKRRSVAVGLILNSLAAAAMAWLGDIQSGALVGLFLFYITFEFTVVGSIPIMTELLPGARATMMAAYIASMSLGRAAGAGLALPLYRWGQSIPAVPGLLVSVMAAIFFNLLALNFLHRTQQTTE
jgi:DHA1 family inner membrane transport protein